MAQANITNTSTGQSGYQVPGAAIPAGWTATPGQISTAVTKGITGQSATPTAPTASQITNPKDIPGSSSNPLQIGTTATPTPTATSNLDTSPGIPSVDPNATSTVVPETAPRTTVPKSATSDGGGQSTSPAGSASGSSQTDPNAALKAKYTQATADLNKSGVPAATSQGSGMAGVKAALDTQSPSQNQDTSAAEAVVKDNQAHQQYLNDYAAAVSTQNSRDSLEQEYTNLSNELGLPQINAQLLNINNVINGTEQNIRDEVSASGGFATNSQVMALATARNKVLIQQQKTLSDTRTNLQQNLTTMMNLAEKDRANADAMITKQLDFDQKNIDFADKAVTNAQEMYKNMAATEGWSGVYQAAQATGDPQAIDRINQIMGQGFDLQSVAANDLKTKKEQEALQNSQLSVAKGQIGLQSAQLKLAQDQAKAANPTATFMAPGEADKSKVFSKIPTLPATTQKTINMDKLSTDPQYFYWVKSQLGL